MLDFVAEHPWVCLLLLIVLCVSVEFAVNRENWKKRSAEITVIFVSVFAAIVFALAQSKYDRGQEGKGKALTFIGAAEVEIKSLVAEKNIRSFLERDEKDIVNEIHNYGLNIAPIVKERGDAYTIIFSKYYNNSLQAMPILNNY
jgi:hypothetical protein